MVTTTQSQQADELRKNGKYLEAIPLYQEQVKTSFSSYPTRWLINCLRKAGKLEEAYKIGNEALVKFPNDKYIKSEVAWVLYDHDLKPCKESGSFTPITEVSKRILEIDPENTFLKLRVTQLVLKIAKHANNPDWRWVAEIAQTINPNELSSEKRTNSDGKSYMSEKEDWFINAAHANLKCGQFKKAIEIAAKGLDSFPNELFLLRTIALAKFQSGDAQTGAEVMRPLLNHPRCEWYIRSELAEMEVHLGNQEEAYRLLCQALLSKQEDQFKVKNLETFASLAMKMNKLEEANCALAFANTIRTNAKWTIPNSLTNLRRECQAAFQKAGVKQPEITASQTDLARTCDKIWSEGALEGMERFRGKVTQIRSDRKYAFIKPDSGGESAIVFLRDLPRDCAVEDVTVEYSLEKSFDVKRNKDSFKAVQVRKIKS